MGYYYETAATHVPEVDAIGIAVDRAGKAYHHTEYWTEKDENGRCVVDDIDDALRACAATITALRAQLTTAERERDEAREELERERLRLAACGVAARGDSRSVNTIYTSDSLKAVVALRHRAERMERVVARVLADARKQFGYDQYTISTDCIDELRTLTSPTPEARDE